MTEFIIFLCFYLLGNLYWIYKANKKHEFLKRNCAPSNPYRARAEGNLNISLLSFVASALVLLTLLSGVPGG